MALKTVWYRTWTAVRRNWQTCDPRLAYVRPVAWQFHLVGNNEGSPVWSSNGNWIAFQSDREGSFQIFVMDANGSTEKRLTDGIGDARSPSWSPDGSKIAFSLSREGGRSHIYVVNADGTNLIQLTGK